MFLTSKHPQVGDVITVEFRIFNDEETEIYLDKVEAVIPLGFRPVPSFTRFTLEGRDIELGSYLLEPGGYLIFDICIRKVRELDQEYPWSPVLHYKIGEKLEQQPFTPQLTIIPHRGFIESRTPLGPVKSIKPKAKVILDSSHVGERRISRTELPSSMEKFIELIAGFLSQKEPEEALVISYWFEPKPPFPVNRESKIRLHLRMRNEGKCDINNLRVELFNFPLLKLQEISGTPLCEIVRDNGINRIKIANTLSQGEEAELTAIFTPEGPAGYSINGVVELTWESCGFSRGKKLKLNYSIGGYPHG